MRILSKKVLRDIRYNKGRSLSIIFIIMLAAALYSGLLLSYEGVGFTFDEIEDDLNSHSVRYILNNFTDPESIDLEQFGYIKTWDYRASLLSGLRIEGDDNIYTSVVYGIEAGRSPDVDNYIMIEGDSLDDATTNELMLTRTFMDQQEMKVGDTVELFVGTQIHDFTVKAKIYSNEFIYSVNPKTGLPDIQGLAPIWLTLEKTQELFGFSGVNEILVRFDDTTNLESREAEIKEYLNTNLGAVSSVTWEEEGDQQMKEGDLGALDDFARVFGIVILLIALFAIYDNVSKLIANQRNYIGTMRALGGSKNKVTNHYTMLASILGIGGAVLGGPLGYVLALILIEEYAALLGIPEPQLQFLWYPYIETFAVMFSLTLIISYLTSRRAAQINPREAMSSSFISQVFTSKPVLERMVNKIPGFKSPSETIAIRNIFRNRRKTLLTIFTYAISTVLIIAALGFNDSFNFAIEENYDKYQTYDLEVYLEAPLNNSALNQLLESIPEIAVYEPFIAQTVDVETDGMSTSTFVYGFLKDSQLRHFNIGEDQSNELVLGSILASELEVDVDEGIEILGYTFTVTGIAEELVSESVYMDLESAQDLLDYSDYFNGVLITLADGVDENTFKQDLQNILPVATIISSRDVQDSITVLIQGLMAFIGAMVFIGFMIAALFSFNTIVLEVISRENEFVNLRSLGSSRWKIAKVILTQSLVISVVGSMLAVPLSYWITFLVVESLVEDLMVLPTHITVQSYAAGILSAFIATLVGIYSGYRYIMKLDLVDALRTRISN